ncbi:hypothetical protein EZV62_020783 [Acer yangbiense]|uniref:Leucine-rich repeat-containing N-terminal plant-type domain-containing protein n=1 Tax=Acer yangbiense TaxID=1000413 RepID=A0A5C7HEY8_9ROSI|nr:hypothetical protein EZV62_020783 [Acer yangbiense]
MSFFIFLYFSFMLFLFHYASSRQPLCHDGERSALLRFKESFSIDCKSASFDPSTYSKTEHWNLEEDMSDCCSWDGVECNEGTGYVIKLDLSSSCLYGHINSTSTLFNLVHLQWLSLADNYFNQSKIPCEMKNLSKLSHLNLSNSYFSGQIPSEILELSKLESLDLSGNLNWLELQQPGLESLVQKLTNLRVLNLHKVNISSSLPYVLTDLSSLNFLSLANCNLKGTILWSFGNLNNLTHLDLSGNNFQGTIPSSLYNLANLAYLDLSYCNFSSLDPDSSLGKLPASLGNLGSLEKLDLGFGDFSGQVPSSFSHLTKVKYLDLSGIHLVGDIPSCLMNLSQLSELYMCCNDQLTGPIPY